LLALEHLGMDGGPGPSEEIVERQEQRDRRGQPSERPPTLSAYAESCRLPYDETCRSERVGPASSARLMCKSGMPFSPFAVSGRPPIMPSPAPRAIPPSQATPVRAAKRRKMACANSTSL
jgi:hypothetical protein